LTDARTPHKKRHRQRPAPVRTVKENSSPRPVAGTATVVGMDKPLLYVTIALAILGLAAVYSASATEAMDSFGSSLYFVQRQFIFFVMGFGLLYMVSRIPYFAWSRVTKLLAIGVIGLLVYTLHSGVEAYGAERWIRILGFQFQPSEWCCSWRRHCPTKPGLSGASPFL
jgi:cell division protein FtsW (lipid II flippase)